MGICPTCGGDLRKCISSGLTEFELLEANTSSKEIEFLLFPHQWETSESSFHEKLGKEFMLLRNNKQLERKDVIAETGLSRHILEDIELGKTVSSRAKLRWYFRYTNYLGVPLDIIFLNATERKEEDPRIKTMAGRYFLTSEDWVMERVQEAIRKLEISGQRITIKAVCDATGFSRRGLYKYDRVKTFIGGILYHKKTPSNIQVPLYDRAYAF
jgi:transcriptional regulator with XRE-family HTH domain